MKLTPEDETLIVALAPDISMREIATKFEVTEYHIRKVYEKHGIKAKPRLVGSKTEKIYALVIQGKSNAEIAELLDCDESNVRQVKLKRGIMTPRKGADVDAYKKKCADVDHLRDGGMQLSEAVKCVGIAPNTYQKYRDKR